MDFSLGNLFLWLLGSHATGIQVIAKSMKFPSVVTVGIVPNKHVFEVSKKNGAIIVEGIEGRFLDLLSETLRFSYQLKAAPDGEPGKKTKNGSWTGLIGMIERKEIDMALDFLCPSEERRKVVDFTDAYEIGYVTFLVDNPGFVSVKMSLIYPFSTKTWICVLIMMVLGPKMLNLILRLKVSYIKLFFESLGNLLRQPFSIPCNGARDRIFLLCWILFAMLVSMYYSSTLLSFLMLPLEKEPIRDFIELAQAVQARTYRCFTLEGCFALSVLDSSPNKDLQSLGTAIEENAWYFDKDDNFGSFRKILKKTAIMDIKLKLELLHNSLNFDSYIMSDDNLVSLNFAIPLRKDFCCKQRLNSVISAIKSAGLYNKFVKEEIFKVFLKDGLLQKTSDPAQLKTDDLYGEFIVLMVGYSLSTILLICEKFYFLYIKRR